MSRVKPTPVTPPPRANYETLRAAARAAYDADDVFSAELERVYGVKRAAVMRYMPRERHTDESLLKAHDAKLAADAAYFGVEVPT